MINFKIDECCLKLMDVEILERLEKVENKLDFLIDIISQGGVYRQDSLKGIKSDKVRDTVLRCGKIDGELLDNALNVFRRLKKVKSFIAPDMLVIEKICKKRTEAHELIRILKERGALIVSDDFVQVVE